MQLAHIPLDQLNISALNMRHGKRAPDISDILPSVRARGVLVPLLVRPNGQLEASRSSPAGGAISPRNRLPTSAAKAIPCPAPSWMMATTPMRWKPR